MGRSTDAGHFLVAPDPSRPGLTAAVTCIDETGAAQTLSVVEERPLTIYLNRREIVTSMTIGDYPDYLAVGFPLNQGMPSADDEITGIDHDEGLQVVVVRTAREMDHEDCCKRIFAPLAQGGRRCLMPPLPAFPV